MSLIPRQRDDETAQGRVTLKALYARKYAAYLQAGGRNAGDAPPLYAPGNARTYDVLPNDLVVHVRGTQQETPAVYPTVISVLNGAGSEEIARLTTRSGEDLTDEQVEALARMALESRIVLVGIVSYEDVNETRRTGQGLTVNFLGVGNPTLDMDYKYGQLIGARLPTRAEVAEMAAHGSRDGGDPNRVRLVTYVMNGDTMSAQAFERLAVSVHTPGAFDSLFARRIQGLDAWTRFATAQKQRCLVDGLLFLDTALRAGWVRPGIPVVGADGAVDYALPGNAPRVRAAYEPATPAQGKRPLGAGAVAAITAAAQAADAVAGNTNATDALDALQAALATGDQPQLADIPVGLLADERTAEAASSTDLVLRLAASLGVIDAHVQGVTADVRAAFTGGRNNVRREVLAKQIHAGLGGSQTNLNAALQFGYARNAQPGQPTNPAVAHGVVNVNTPVGRMYLAQASSVSDSLAATLDAYLKIKEKCVGKVLSSGVRGSKAPVDLTRKSL